MIFLTRNVYKQEHVLYVRILIQSERSNRPINPCVAFRHRVLPASGDRVTWVAEFEIELCQFFMFCENTGAVEQL